MSEIIDIEIVEKFNPYHGPDGRFTSADGATLFTYRTKAPYMQGMADKAIEREKKRTADDGSDFGLTPEQHKKLEGLATTTLFSANDYRKELGMSDDDFEKYKEKYNIKEKRKTYLKDSERQKEQEKRERLKQEDERAKQELPGLDQEAIRRANDQSMFDTGSVRARDALKRLDSYRERNKMDDSWTDEQKEYFKQREEEYKQLLTDYYNDANRRTADNPSWAVTGRAGYNFNRYEKKMNAAMNKANEYEEKLSRFEENTNKRLKSMASEDTQISRWRQGKWSYGESIDASDPLATKKLQAKLDYLTESQANMKAANAYYRKNGTMKGFSGYSERENELIEAKMARDWRSEKKPFQSYELTNNNATIKATKDRLKSLENQKSKVESRGATGSFKGGQIVRNTENNRLQLIFDGKPSEEVRAQLKRNGFKWAPSQGAWQRQLTDNAERALEGLMGTVLEKMYIPAQTFSAIRKSRGGEPVEKAVEEAEQFQIMKADDDKREVFGWALVAIRKDGEQIVDHQQDVVDPDELEHAAYEYVLNFRDTGEMHNRDLRKKGKLIESVVFTEEKRKAMGIPEGILPNAGWWIGFRIEDEEAWQKVKNGNYRMFSIEGSAIRQEVPDGE